MIEAQVHCGLESPGVGFGLHGRGEVVPLDGHIYMIDHQRDEAADSVRGQKWELDGLRLADELCCLGLDVVEEGEGRGRGAEPDGAAVFHAGADVGLVDGRQRRAGDHMARAPQVPVC